MPAQCVTRKVVVLRWHKWYKSSSAPQHKYPGLKRWNISQKKILSITTGGQNEMCDFRATMLYKTKSKWNKQAPLQKPQREEEPRALPPWNRTFRFWSTVEQGMWPTTGVIKITRQSAWTKRETLPSLRGHASHKNTTQSKWPTRQTYACKGGRLPQGKA